MRTPGGARGPSDTLSAGHPDTLMLDLDLERMWRLPPRLPRPDRPVVSPFRALNAQRRQLTRESRCFVCRALTGSRDGCYVTFLGVWIHYPPEGPRLCYDVLRLVGKDYSRSRRGRWLGKWQVLVRLAGRWS
jgi:hypothetical protein